MKRPRHLSAEERALWDSVAKQAKPLRQKKRTTVAILPSPLVGEGRTDAGKSGKGEGDRRASPPHPSSRAAGTLKPSPTRGEGAVAKASPARLSLERRERSRLARGHREIDARIDLHGMTLARAHRALLAFLHRAQADGCRYVLVITGKGKVSAEGSERGVLRRQVPDWFGLAEFRVLVAGYEEAAIGHGGAGALYVRVRRG